MAIARLTRSVRFAAAHRYHRPEWSEAENVARFGACANPHGHGHSYTLDVTVQGTIDEATGYCVDLGELDALLEREVVARFDHQHLNHVVDEFAPGGRIPTTENILHHLWPRLVNALPSGTALIRLRLHEEPGLYADYFGGSEPADAEAQA